MTAHSWAFCLLSGFVACATEPRVDLSGTWDLALERDTITRSYWEFAWRPDTIVIRAADAIGTVTFGPPAAGPDCRRCLYHGTFAVGAGTALVRQPVNQEAIAHVLRPDSIFVKLGASGDMGEVELLGALVRDSITGRWNQIFNRSEPLPGGTFLLRRAPR
jgi:hypothetical protein